jgi:hypothetical protein
MEPFATFPFVWLLIVALPPRLRREFEVWSEISAAAEVRSMGQDYEDCTEALAR